MTEVMLDFETFGNGKRACIVQIGACYFNRVTGQIGDTYKKNVDARDAVKNGGVIDADTIYWWLGQSPQAIQSITSDPKIGIVAAMGGLNEFLKDAKCIWSHATFDFVILSETLRQLGIKPNFRYQSARDIRTLIDITGTKIEKSEREGTHHDALDDCKFQVKYVVQALRIRA